MGGVYGHIPHLWEAKNLSFRQIKDILKLASQDRLEDLHEKPDGVQVCFSYDLTKNKPVFARNNKDIAEKGLDVASLLDKYADKPLVKKLFEEAFVALNMMLNEIRHKCYYFSDMIDFFGVNCDKWYSLEILFPNNLNVIKYDKNMLVLHAQPMFVRKIDGTVSTKHNDNSKMFRRYEQCINEVLKAIDWTFSMPIERKLWCSIDKIVYESIEKIDHLVDSFRMSDVSTPNDMCALNLRQQFDIQGLSSLAKHYGSKYALKLISYQLFRKHVTKHELSLLRPILNVASLTTEKTLRPLEKILYEFGVSWLKCLSSCLVNDEKKEIERLKDCVTVAADDILKSGHEKAIVMLERQLERLGDIDNISTGFEGVTFSYGGCVYKCTGSFAPINQILGMYRYDRCQ